MVGRTVAHYRIVAELGAGGMGIVYKAHDVRLERFLALKFLKPERVTDDFRRRFLQEARSASALHHPNIVHVYDIGVFEGQDYIAMEFVDGSSLRQILRERRIAVAEAVRYSLQIADAMGTAHAAGIVHRDLKPANLMITPAGLVKILDFGLAKLAAQPPAVTTSSPAAAAPPSDDPDATSSAITISADRTQLGVAVGSPAYMSPEQAMGRAVDGRSDIFSFGSILFEMLVGQRAFPGEATREVISAVIQYTPPPPSLFNSDVSRELDTLVQRAIQKDPAKRFQTMEELKAGLDALEGGGSATFLVEPPMLVRRRRRKAALASAAAILVIGPLVYLAVRNHPPTLSGAVTTPLQATRLTLDPGLNVDPAISPDGKFVAYSSDRSGDGNLDIWVRQIAGGSDPIRVTRDPADDREPAFSPDGAQIAFRSNRAGGGIYLVPTLGGEEQEAIPQGRGPRFSPDGRQIAYWKGLADPFPLRTGNGSAFVYDLATRRTRQIAADFPAAVHPVWSPDGKYIAFIGLKDPADLHTFNWWIVPVEGGPPVICPVNTNQLLVPFAWRGDWIFYETGGGQIGARIGRVRIHPKTFQPVSPPASLTAGTTDEFCPSVSRDGLVVFAGEARNTNIYALRLDVNRGKPLGAPQPLTRDLGENSVRSVSPDGRRVVFLTHRPAHDSAQVWALDMANGRERALTAGGRAKTMPEISPDGSLVAWRENSVNVTEMFVTPFDGGAAAKLCGDCQGQPVWSATGEFVLVSQASARGTIGIVERSSGRQSVYTKAPQGLDLRARAISRDGRWLAFTANRSQANYTICVAPFAPDRAPAQTEWIEVASSVDAEPYPRWSPDGNLLYFGSARDGYTCLWAQRLHPRTKHPEGKPFAVQHFHLPTLGLQAPNFNNPFGLAAGQALISITERAGGLWTLDVASGQNSRQK